MSVQALRIFGLERSRYVGPITSPRPDETFYSWIARASLLLGDLPQAAIARIFFGGVSPKYYPDLPVGLDDFIRSSGQIDCTIEECAVQLSGYGYYANFLAPDERHDLLTAMSTSGSFPPLLLGMNLSHVRVERLRFCPECHNDMDEQFGGRWWRRTHQLPSSRMCPDHRMSLFESSVDQAEIAKRFCLPSDVNCASQTPMVDQTASGDLRGKLLLLARMGRFYLANVQAKSRIDWAQEYVLGCRQLDLANGNPQAMVQPVHSALMQFWKRFDGCVPFPFIKFESQRWVHSLLLGREGSTPMEHLFMQAMLPGWMNDEARPDRKTWLN